MYSLQEKIFLIQSMSPYMKKDAKAYNFNYTNEETVLAWLKPELQKYGLTITPEIESHSISVDLVTKKVKGVMETTSEYLYSGQGYMAIRDFDSKEEIKVPWSFIGSGADPAQAYGSALTYCNRYFMLKYFQVPTGKDDPDSWRSNQEEKVDPVLTASQRNKIGTLVKSDADKARLKGIINNLGYQKLAEVKQTDFNKLLKLYSTADNEFPQDLPEVLK